MSILGQVFRRRNTNRSGYEFTPVMKQAVWNKARPVVGLDPSLWRMDACNALMQWSDYGSTVEGGYGWEIDHILPVAHGGLDHFTNLQALQWQNNRTKGDSLTKNYCQVTYH